MSKAKTQITKNVLPRVDSASASNYLDFGDLNCDHGQTDHANATRFVDKFHNQLLFVPAWKKWLGWDGKRWAEDNNTRVYQLAKSYAKSLFKEVGNLAEDPTIDPSALNAARKFAKQSNDRNRMQNFVAMAQCDHRVVCDVDELNRNPNLLNVQNGTVDLQTGQLLSHNSNDRLTQVAGTKFNPAAKCPQWEETIDLVFDGDQELSKYVQQLLGYSISGLFVEAVLPICYGDGNNGKSTVWNVVSLILGDYATMANHSLLLAVKQGHDTQLANLYQRRFVAISEPEKGLSLSEARVKELTGDKIVSCRRLYENYWAFVPTHTFWLSTNHKPQISGTDEGIWRRIKLIPFTVDIGKKTKVKKGFIDTLVREEASGILNWLLAGFASWRKNGFQEPGIVKQATAEYRLNEDQVARFIAERCIEKPGIETPAKLLQRAFRSWGGTMSDTSFGTQLGARYQKLKRRGGPNRDATVYRGIGLLNESNNPA